MQRKYGKPLQLSYPYQFHKYQPEKIAEILNKSDGELTLEDFGFIFSMHEPDADYQEGLYYIPLCFEKMEEACPFERNVCISLFWYIEFFKHRLIEDGFYAECIQGIESYFEMITGDFAIRKEYEPSRRYRLTKLEYGLTVDTIVFGAVSSDETWKILSKLLFGLKNKDAVGSCWWIMISYFSREWIMHARKGSYTYKKRKILFEHFHKFGEYSKHFERARNYTQEKGTYEYLPQFAVIPFNLG